MDVMAMAKATGKTALDLVKFLLHELRRLFFCLLLAFELLFILRSFHDLLVGGTGMMVGWWWHLQLEMSSVDRLFLPANWSMFLVNQILMLAIIGTLWFFERRLPKAAGSQRATGVNCGAR
jgi:hypothetical protein